MQLAELNIGRLLAPRDDPRVADFMNNLDLINGLGKRMPGFVWIMEGDDGAGNTETAIDGDAQLIPNLTVWQDAVSLHSFVYKTLHSKFMDRRSEWFEVLADRHFVMWWIDDGHQPDLAEAMDRLTHLRDNGDSEFAFGWEYLRAQGTLPD